MRQCNFITFGNVLREVKTESFEITEAKHLPDYRIPRHRHNSMNIVCVLKGSFVESFQNKEFTCSPNNFIFKPVGAIHSDHFQKSGSHTILISIKNEKIRRLGQLVKIFEDIRLLNSAENLSVIEKIHNEISAPDNLSEFALEGLTLELFTNFSRQIFKKQNPADPKWLVRAKDYIHANFDQKLSLSIVADQIGVHPSHLARVFRQNYQVSIGEYVRKLRIEFAAGQLINTEKSLPEISAEAGFYDQSHFTNLFKKTYGTTPANFRISKGKN